MGKYLEDKNFPALIIFTLIVAVGLVAGIGSWNAYQTNNKMNYLLSLIPQQAQQQETQQYVDEFELLSSEAKQFYKNMDVDKVTGTPTWFINNKKYVGFDYQNNKIPGIEEGLIFESVVLFSSPTCGFCKKAETWLKLVNVDYKKVCAPIHSGDYELCKQDNSFIS